MENGVDWGEGFLANNIEIINNTFINCGFDTSFVDDPAGATISTDISKLKSPCNDTYTWCGTEPVVFQGFQNINIKNNSFLYNKTGINLQNINGGIITGNTFVHNAPDATLKVGETPNNILWSNSSNLVFDAMGNLSFEEYKIKLNRNGDLLSIIDEGNEDSGFTIALFDSTGKKLQTKTSDSNVTVFDVSNYQKGMYIITIENKQFKTFKKVML